MILPWGEPDGYLRKVILPGLAKQFGFDLNTPWGELSQHVRDVHARTARADDAKAAKRRATSAEAKWEGILANVQRRYNETESDSVRVELDGVHEARAVHDLRRTSPQAGVARGHDRWQEHR